MLTTAPVAESGILTTLLNVGMDFLIIMITELALPMIFAAIDFLMCVLDFFAPAGWNDQLECVENTCFKGPSITSDLMVFTGVPVIIGRFTAIMDATLNSRSGQKFVSGFSGEFTTKGRTQNVQTGQQVNNNEPENAQAGSPVKAFTFAEDFDDFLFTAGAQECRACFVCKVPELRLVWLLVASIGSLFSSEGFNTFMGNVTDNCLANGSFYERACGPRGAEELTFVDWKTRGYTAGFAQIDSRIFDAYAAEILDMKEQGEVGRDPKFGQLVAAAEQWDEASDNEDVMYQKAESLVYHFCRNMRNEAAFRGLEFDTPNDFHMLPSGSLEYVSSRFLFETCKRFKYEIFSDPGRWMHQAGYDLAACGQDQVACKKASVKCLGTCGGTSGSLYQHDFSTIVSRTELSQFALGDGFDDAAAADCNVRSYVFRVPTFEGGDSFKTWAARARIRSGMTALSNEFCNTNARSCAAVP